MLSVSAAFKEQFGERYGTAPLDAKSFLRPYRTCKAIACGALCCQSGCGFYLPEERAAIDAHLARRPDFFRERLPQLTLPWADEDVNAVTGEMEYTTRVVEAQYPPGLKPPHLASTACIFRDGRGACTLQALALAEEKHGWEYKPFGCWLFPIELDWQEEACIHVAHKEADPYKTDDFPGFFGFTPCAERCEGGIPAYEALAQEITMLSQLLERDLRAEILAAA